MKQIQNIIFDLGGVIINLDYGLTIQEFNRISNVPFESIYTKGGQTELFNAFDMGKITEFDFFSELRKQLRYEGDDENMLAAWNAMLLDIPEERLDMLVELKQRYNTYLLSNTCETHIDAFERSLYLEHGVKNFNDYFDHVYYSCRFGMRKPDKAIFEMVLKKNSLVPEETVFIDDSEQHVKAAGECGINAFLLPKDIDVIELLQELNLLDES